MTTLVNIRCRHLALTISREACGAQVTRTYAPAACRGCEVGLAHARGEVATCWPDGEAVEEVAHPVPGPVSERRVELRPASAFSDRHKPPRVTRRDEEPAVRGADRRGASYGQGAHTYVYDGRELTVRELAALPGVEVPASTIKNRLGDGWGLERAIWQRVDESRRTRRSA